jgi:thiol-disulfide isomerase/thioredoxin
MTGVLAVLGALLLASAFGLWRRRTDGRVRAIAPSEPGPVEDAAAISPFAAFGEMGERATIVQFSATVCAPCRAAKVIAHEVAAQVPGVRHLEINAESNMELVREFGILRTPTILVLDGRGRLSARISGVPRREELLIALDDRRFEDI